MRISDYLNTFKNGKKNFKHVHLIESLNLFQIDCSGQHR